MINLIVEYVLPIFMGIVAIASLTLSDRRTKILVNKYKKETLGEFRDEIKRMDKEITSLKEHDNHQSQRITRLHKACETIEQETFKNTRASERAESKVDTAIQWIKFLVNILLKGKENG